MNEAIESGGIEALGVASLRGTSSRSSGGGGGCGCGSGGGGSIIVGIGIGCSFKSSFSSFVTSAKGAVRICVFQEYTRCFLSLRWR